MNDMKTCLIICLVAVCASVSCTTEVPVTVEVRVTREVEVTRELEVTREVEVLPASLRLTLCADYPYITELAELQLGLFDAAMASADPAISDLFDVEKSGSERVSDVLLDALNFNALKEEKTGRERFADRLQTAKHNQIEICGHDLEPFGTIQREMRSLDGVGVCTATFSLIRDTVAIYPNWDNAPSAISEAALALADGYDSYCDNYFAE